MKKELLSPAGNMDALKQAIHNGCDAVYIAGKNFGARAFAPNFSLEELKEAVAYAHIYNVLVYVTVNTIIYESEINDVLDYIAYLYQISVDALIIQDIGLMVLVKKYFPDFEIHASTQCNTNNIDQINFLETLGVKRVVVSRETPLTEINSWKTNVELEAFIHGALCICYSGCCLFSSFKLNRSGNRGSCAGLCRLPYSLYKNNQEIIKNKYILSPKELNTSSEFEKLKKSQVKSFKIEGRMKSPEYVGYVTKLYRKLLDHDNYKLTKTEIYNLASLFNRGFTKGYIFNNTSEEFISLTSSNHQGIKVGEVISTNKYQIKIKLSHDIEQYDGVRLPNNKGMIINYLYNNKNLLINKAKTGDIIYLDNIVNLTTIGTVLLTTNNHLKKEILNTKPKKIKINAYVYAHINKELKIKYQENNFEVEVIGSLVNVAKTSPLTKERITEILGKLGDTPFILDDIKFDMDDNIFIPVGVLNELRRTLISKLIEEKTKTRETTYEPLKFKTYLRKEETIEISALARTEEQIKTLLSLNISTIYTPSKELYLKYKNNHVYLRIDRISNKEEYHNESLLIGELGSLRYTKNNEVISDYYLNVVNSSYVDLLNKSNVKRITLSPELTLTNLLELKSHVSPDIELETIIYGRIEYMVMKYDLNIKKNENYYLANQNDLYPIMRDNHTHLFSEKPLDRTSWLPKLKESGFKYVRLELFDETKDQIISLINKIKANLKGM